jgi:hypothetical protein
MPDAHHATVTVAIPLHRGRRWVENVLGNIARLRGHARVLVSDAHEHDDALRRIRQDTATDGEVRFIGRRDLPAGWVPHYNDLLDRVDTPLMMWLPQDDEIDADWIAGGVRALHETPAAVVASGTMQAVADDGCERAGLTVVGSPLLESAVRDTRIAAAAEFLCRDWGPIGLPFRGVFRRERAFPLTEARPRGEWADILWLLGMVARGPFVTTPGAVYGKRFYSSSEHVWWSSFARSGDSVPLTLDALRAALGGHDLPAISAAWRGDRAGLLFLLEHAEDVMRTTAEASAAQAAHIEALDDELRAARSAAEAERVRRAQSEADARRARADSEAARTALATVFASRSWRVTGPIRRLGAAVRSRVRA